MGSLFLYDDISIKALIFCNSLREIQESEGFVMPDKNAKNGIMSKVFTGAKRNMALKARPEKVPEVMETVQDSIPIYTVHEKRKRGPRITVKILSASKTYNIEF